MMKFHVTMLPLDCTCTTSVVLLGHSLSSISCPSTPTCMKQTCKYNGKAVLAAFPEVAFHIFLSSKLGNACGGCTQSDFNTTCLGLACMNEIGAHPLTHMTKSRMQCRHSLSNQ